MAGKVRGEGARNKDSFLAAHIAWLHFQEKMTNLAIAEQLGISRFRVARQLEYALESGIVQVTITPPFEIDATLSEAIRKKYSLSQALVLPGGKNAGNSEDESWARRGVGELTARYLSDILLDGSKIGISWGYTIDAVAAAVEGLPNFPTCDVVQLVGGLSTVEDAAHASDVLRRFANATGGSSYPLHAPIIVPDATTAKGLKSERSIARTLGMVPQLDAAVVGVGSWDPPTSHMMEVLPEDDVEEALAAGAAADVCATVLDHHGVPIAAEVNERIMRAQLIDLKDVPNVVIVAAGRNRVPALKSILPTEIGNVLVTDAATAQGLLKD